MSTEDRIEYLEAQVIELEQTAVILRKRLHREETRSERQWEIVSNLWDQLNGFENYYRTAFDIAPPPATVPPYQARHRASPGRYPSTHPESATLRSIASRNKKPRATTRPLNLVIPFAQQPSDSRKRPAPDTERPTTTTTVPQTNVPVAQDADDNSAGTETIATVASAQAEIDLRPFVGKKVRVTNTHSEHLGAVFLVRRVRATKCVCNTYPCCSDKADTYFSPQTIEIIDHDSEVDLTLLTS